MDELNSIVTDLLSLLDGGLADSYGIRGAMEGLDSWKMEMAKSRDRLMVVVVGEFNAGKSSLINAIFGRPVAFTDAFVATTGNTTYVRGSAEGALVRYAGGQIERWTLEEYMKRCADRSLRQTEQVEVSLPHAYPFDITDTPGMASIHEKDDVRAEEAVRSADVLVWVIDPMDLLSAHEGAFLTRAKEIGIPILLALSKADMLADDEVELSVSCLVDRLGYPAESIFACSAERHLETRADPGTVRLIESLVKMAEDGDSVKRQASEAKQLEIRSEVGRIVALLTERNDRESEWVARERDLIRKQADIVREKLAIVLEDLVRGSLFRHLDASIPSEVPPERIQPLAERALQTYVDNILPGVSDELRRRARAEARAVWDEQFDTRAGDLQNQIDALVGRGIEHQNTIEFLREQLSEVVARQAAVRRAVDDVETRSGTSDETTRTAMNSMALGLMGAVLTASAWPLLIGGAIATLALNQPQTRRVRPVDPRAMVRADLLREFAANVAANVRRSLCEPLDRYVSLIESEALDLLTSRHYQGRTPATIALTRDRLRALSPHR